MTLKQNIELIGNLIRRLPISSPQLRNEIKGQYVNKHEPLFFFAGVFVDLNDGNRNALYESAWKRHFNLEIYITMANYCFALGDEEMFASIVREIDRHDCEILIDQSAYPPTFRKAAVFFTFYKLVGSRRAKAMPDLKFTLELGKSRLERHSLNERLLEANGNLQQISEILNFNLISSDANCLKDCVAKQGKAVPAPSEAAPVFSIITSVHVLHENLAAALDSVRYQTYPNFEHLIVVDSNDSDLLEFLAMYSNEDPRITVIPKGLNLGTYHSRNLALTHALGKYAMAHDSDDLLTLDALHRYLAGFQENDVVAIGGKSLRITDSNETLSPDHDGYVLRLGYPTFCFEVSLTQEIGFFDAVRHSGDSEFISRVAKFYPEKILWLSDCLLLQHDGDGNLTKTVSLGVAGYLTSSERRNYRNAYKQGHELLNQKTAAQICSTLSSSVLG